MTEFDSGVGGDAGDGERRLTAVVVTMKPRLRGRIRRTVETLLRLGYTVVLLTHADPVPIRGDLSHPQFMVLQVPTRSWLERAQTAIAAISARRLARQRTARGWFRRTRGAGTWLHAEFDQPVRVLAGPRRRSVRWAVRWLQLLAIRWVRRTGRAVVRLRNAGWRVLVRTVRSALRPFHRFSRFLAYWQASSEVAVAAAPDLVVSSDLPGLVGASRAARRLRRPHVHDCHELYLESTALTRLDRWLFRRYERRHMRRADLVLAVNHSIATEYRRRYRLRRVRVVRNCAQLPVRLQPVSLRDLARLPARSSVVLYQGGFSPGRGLDVLIDGVSRLPAQVALVLLGFGSLEEELRRQAAARGIADRFRILPAVRPEDLLAVTASATVGVIPYQPVSRNNYFCLPNKVFEYTAVGVPIIAADLPELRKIAVGAGCGVVFDSYDPGSFTAAANDLLQPHAYERAKAAAGRYGMENHWDVERRRFETALARVMPAAPARPAGRRPAARPAALLREATL